MISASCRVVGVVDRRKGEPLLLAPVVSQRSSSSSVEADGGNGVVPVSKLWDIVSHLFVASRLGSGVMLSCHQCIESHAAVGVSGVTRHLPLWVSFHYPSP